MPGIVLVLGTTRDLLSVDLRCCMPGTVVADMH